MVFGAALAGVAVNAASAQERNPTYVEVASPKAVESTIEAVGFVDETLIGHKVEGCKCGKCTNTCCCTDKKKAELAEKAKGAYKGVFYANDYSYLDDPCYEGHDLGDSLKRLAGGRLDLGGEARVRYHHENNFRGFGLTGVDDEFWLDALSNVQQLANQ